MIAKRPKPLEGVIGNPPAFGKKARQEPGSTDGLGVLTRHDGQPRRVAVTELFSIR